MGNLFNLILDNFFLFFLIISGIIGFLSGNKKEEEKKTQQRPVATRRPQSQPETRKTRTSPAPQRGGSQEIYTTQTETTEPNVITTSSPQAEQRVQVEKLQKKVDGAHPGTTGNFIADQDLTFSKSLAPIKEFTEEQEVLRSDIRKSLKGKRLINGIIMAEVLGKPRSLKPYESPTLERYKK